MKFYSEVKRFEVACSGKSRRPRSHPWIRRSSSLALLHLVGDAVEGAADLRAQDAGILTTTANELAAEVHDRMPVILPISAEHRWVTHTGHGVHYTFPFVFPADQMRSYPVTPKMNKASFNEPDAIAPLEAMIA